MPVRAYMLPAVTVLLLNTCCLASAARGPRKPTYRLSDMKVLYGALGRIQKRYVDRSRLHPDKMLEEALDAIQRQVPEVLVRRVGPGDFYVQVDTKSKRFKVGRVNSLWKLTEVLRQVFLFVGPHLHASTDPKKVEFAAVDGILSTLDPHSILLRPDFFKEFEVDTEGQFGGLGIEISICDGKLTIRRPLPNTPAWNTRMKYGRKGIYRIAPAEQACRLTKAKGKWTCTPVDPASRELAVGSGDSVVRLRAGDRILRIEDESTVNMTLSESVKRLRGKPNTDVLIWIQRKGWRRPRPFYIRRAVVRVSSVTFRWLRKPWIHHRLGYVRITRFQSTTAAELRTALKDKLTGKGRLEGIVLDLRGNHGGLLDQAASVVDAFVSTGTIVASKGSRGTDQIRARRQTTMAEHVPLVVLTDQETASAAEIVSAALKQLDRGVVVGRRTFGKGSVQVIFPLAYGTGLKLTVSQWLAPGNLSIQNNGLVPDVLTLPVSISKDEPIEYYSVGRQTRQEKDLRAALAVPTVELKSKPFAVVRYLERPIPPEALALPCRYCGQPKQTKPMREPSAFVWDFDVDLAARILERAGTDRRLATLAKARQVLQEARRREQRAIEAKLRSLGIDWSKGDNGQVRLEASFLSGRFDVTAGQRVTVAARVTNRGTKPVHRIWARIETSGFRLKDVEMFFGRIPPGQTRTARVTIRMPAGLVDQEDWLKLDVYDQPRQPLASKWPKPVATARSRLVVHGLRRPSFLVTYSLREAKDSDGDGLFEPGEWVEMPLVVRNVGEGPVREGYAVLQNRSGSAVFIASGRFPITGLRPGAKRRMVFRFKIRRVPKGRFADLRLRAYDCVLGRDVTDSLKLYVADPDTRPRATRLSLRLGPNAQVRLCPDEACPRAALPKGAIVTATGRIRGWYRLASATGPLFVRIDAVRGTKPGGRRRRVRAEVVLRPPRIHLPPVPLKLASRTYDLEVWAEHPEGVADVYVTVSNVRAKIFDRKVAYRSAPHKDRQHRLSLRAHLRLWPGKNFVRIVARHNDQVTSSRLVVILVEPAGSSKSER